MMARRCALALALAAAIAPASAQQPASPRAGTAIPDFSGVWHRWFRPGLGPAASGPGPVENLSRLGGVSNYNQLVGDYHNPILKPGAVAVVQEHGALALSGAGYPTPSNQCWPGGVPYVFWNFGMQMLQQPKEITMLYFHDHEVRRVRMNASHPAHVTPSWYGDSVGHYDGGTLVIDTVGVKRGPFPMMDMYGTPFRYLFR